MRRPLVAFLLALSALAGCVGSATPGGDDAGTPAATRDPGPGGEAGEGNTPGTPTKPASGNATGNGNGGGTTTQANSTSTSKNQTPVPPPPPPPRTREVAGEGHVTAKARTPCPDPAPCPALEHEAAPVEMALPEPNPYKATLVAAWDAGQTTAILTFNVTTAEGVVVAQGEGESPVSLTLPADLLKGTAKLLVAASPPTPGVIAQQDFQLTLSLEYA